MSAEGMKLRERIWALERATAVAYLDANLDGMRYNALAMKITKAIKDKKHYRLVVVPTPSGGVTCDIEVGEPT